MIMNLGDINNNRLTIKQQKTQEMLTILLHDTALEILNKQRQKNHTKVFNITSYVMWRRYVPEITKQAGIERRITGHCARHTFATQCLKQGAGIRTVQKLLAHSSITTTEKYAHVVDEMKDDAIRSLPKL